MFPHRFITLFLLAATCYFSRPSHAITLTDLLQDPAPPRPLVYKQAGPEALKLYVFSPSDTQARHPAIVCIHGGGWSGGTADTFFPHARYFAARGAVGVSLEYRLIKGTSPTVADAVADCKSAIRYLRTHAAALGIDPARIAALGDSAGGHMAACLGTIDGCDDPQDDRTVSARPNALVLCNPIVDMAEGGFIKHIIAGTALERHPPAAATQPSPTQLNLARQLSPLHHIAPGQPPTLLMHGLDDHIVSADQSRLFTAAMIQAGNRCDLVLLEKTRHAFIVPQYTAPEPVVVDALRRADTFLISLGYLSAPPTLQLSPTPAWPAKRPYP